MHELESSLFASALATDNAWQAELEAVYGQRASEARYNRALNTATPLLKALHDMREHAHEAWILSRRMIRNEIAA